MTIHGQGPELGDRQRAGGEAVTRPVSILPPYRVMDAFLDEASVETLLELALSRQADFEPTMVGRRSNARLDPAFRSSLVLRPRQVLARVFETRLRELAPVLTADMRLSAFEASAIELELVAHGDGAFYKRHIDTQTGGDAKSLRILSGVYYFNRRPKAFAGGALRLYAIGDDDRFIDVEPEHNSLLIFPSWAPHEVMPVNCPSKAFINSRFAVNCWILRRAA